MLTTFLLLFACLRFYTKNIVLSLVVALAAALLGGVPVFYYLNKKRQKKAQNTFCQKAKKELALYLMLSSQKDVKALLSPHIEQSEAEYLFRMKALETDDIAPILQERQKSFTLCCNLISAECRNLCKSLEVTIQDINDIYDLLKRDNALPNLAEKIPTAKKGVFSQLKGTFGRKLCGPLFRCGVILLFFSFFTAFPIYYLIFGSILLLLCAVALVVGG
jgi:hypothetical protein